MKSQPKPPTDDVLNRARDVTKRSREVYDWLAHRFKDMVDDDRKVLARNIALLEALKAPGADSQD